MPEGGVYASDHARLGDGGRGNRADDPMRLVPAAPAGERKAPFGGLSCGGTGGGEEGQGEEHADQQALHREMAGVVCIRQPRRCGARDERGETGTVGKQRAGRPPNRCVQPRAIQNVSARGIRGRVPWMPPHGDPAPLGIPGEGLSRQDEFELEQRAERYSELHGDDETEREPGLIRRVLNRLRRYRS